MKGQAAMEYLMTYGWALLVIVIVIGILLVLNPFASPQGCRFEQLGFTCPTPIVKSDGSLYMQITNGNNNDIVVQNVTCVQGTSTVAPTFATSTAWTAAKAVQRQGSFELSNSTVSVKCKKADGTAIGTLNAGADFSGKVWIFYKNSEDPGSYPVRVTSATITTKVVQ